MSNSSKAEYRPVRGRWPAKIVQNGKIVCMFRMAPTDAQGHAMAEGLNLEFAETLAVPTHNKTE